VKHLLKGISFVI